MPRAFLTIIVTLLLVTRMASCGRTAPSSEPTTAQVVVFAAASTTDAVGRIAARYRESAGHDVVTNFASSSTLARQIEEGATAHVYISANVEWMDYLADRELLTPGTRGDFLSNRLVLVVPKGAPPRRLNVDSLPGRVVLGDPEHVPAGRYAMQAIRALGLEEALKDRIVPAQDVRAALRLVEMGEVDCGIVYASDAIASDRVDVIETLDESLHAPVRYQIALVGEPNDEVRQFLEYLRSDEAATIFRDVGLTVIRE